MSMMTMRKMILFLVVSTLCLLRVGAQGNVHSQSEQYEWPTDPLVVEHLHQWQDMKFGVLIHWGLYAVPGIVESWSICDENWITRDTTMTYQQYKDWYWGFAEQFNPTKFNPTQWAEAAEDAGMKYVIFTTKHHDGFCMYDSQETDFTITRHAFAAHPQCDVLKYVFDAFRAKGFMAGAYFSKPDWHSQYYWWDVYPTKGRNVNYPISKYTWRWQQFKDFTYRQIAEVLSRYGKVDILWLDGGWVCPENHQDIDMERIARMARQRQPGIIMVDRTIHGPFENYQTPERTIPDTQLDYPWESCIPLSDDWGYVRKPRWKTPEQVINTLVEIVAKGGNLVLGVGPTPEGLFQPEVTQRLKDIGQWMRDNGKAIYHTVTTPHYHDGDVWFTASKDGKRLYAIYMHEPRRPWPAQVSWRGNLPHDKNAVRLVKNGRKVKCQIHDDVVSVTLPAGLPHQSVAFEIKQ